MAKDTPEERHDVVILGTGIAGLSTSIAAREAGADVLILEKAPLESRGGNTHHSGGLLRAPRPDFGYTEDKFWNDLMRTTRGRANQELGRVLVGKSDEAIQWLTKLGMVWAPPRHKPDEKSVTGYRAMPQPYDGHHGYGNGLFQQMFVIAEKMGVKVLYEAKGEHLLTDAKRRVVGVRALCKDGFRDFMANAVVLACGGFQANTEMRVRYFGRWWDNIILRGTKYNTGDGIRMAMEIGATSAGQWGDGHCAPVDARSSRSQCGETNVNTFPYSVLVNKECKRFLDEGEDFHINTYVKTAKAALEQPEGIAYAIFDEKHKDKGLVWSSRMDLYPPTEAKSIRDLAGKLGLDPNALDKTISDFNAACRPGHFDPESLDGVHTVGVEPPKSNWALPLDTPPFYAFPVTGGVTFTFGGLKADIEARVIDTEDRPIAGLYAVGEITGEFFYYNYPGGGSLMRGAVFGRIAGRNAAKERA